MESYLETWIKNLPINPTGKILNACIYLSKIEIISGIRRLRAANAKREMLSRATDENISVPEDLVEKIEGERTALRRNLASLTYEPISELYLIPGLELAYDACSTRVLTPKNIDEARKMLENEDIGLVVTTTSYDDHSNEGSSEELWPYVRGDSACAVLTNNRDKSVRERIISECPNLISIEYVPLGMKGVISALGAFVAGVEFKQKPEAAIPKQEKRTTEKLSGGGGCVPADYFYSWTRPAWTRARW